MTTLPNDYANITFLTARKHLLASYKEWRLRRLLRRSAARVDDGSLLAEPDDIELADLGEGGIRVVRKDDADGLMTVQDDDGTEFVMRAPLAKPEFKRGKLNVKDSYLMSECLFAD